MAESALRLERDDDGVWQLAGGQKARFGLANDQLGYLEDRNYSSHTVWVPVGSACPCSAGGRAVHRTKCGDDRCAAEFSAWVLTDEGAGPALAQCGVDLGAALRPAPHTEEPTHWYTLHKANREKLVSGDVNKVAEVVRDLWRRDQERGLSAGEKLILAKVRQILVGESPWAASTEDAKAETLLDAVLAAAS